MNKNLLLKNCDIISVNFASKEFCSSLKADSRKGPLDKSSRVSSSSENCEERFIYLLRSGENGELHFQRGKEGRKELENAVDIG